MIVEPTREEISPDDDAPASKSDLRKVEDNLRTEIEGVDQRLLGVEGRLARVEGRLDRVDQRLDRVEATMATKEQVANVLDVIQSIDERLKAWGDVPGRLDQLEEDVAELMLKR